MLIIRPAQLSELEKLAEDQFVSGMVEQLASEYGHCATLPPEERRRQVLQGIELARQYDIKKEGDVARFLQACEKLGPGGDALPRTAVGILSSYRMSAEDKLTQLEDWVRSQMPAESPRPKGFGTRAVGSATQGCDKAADHLELHWIEIRLVDSNGKPVPWVEYSVVLPSGEEATGYLDKYGRALLDPLDDAGICKVSFPGLDAAIWRRSDEPSGNTSSITKG